MQSTLSSRVPEYIGVDLTDRYSDGCRDIDVCGLTPSGNNQLQAQFWYWRWDRAPHALDVTAIAAELRAARVTMLDGPQAFAVKGAAIRVCERLSGAAGKTPDSLPAIGRPYAGFLCSSLELFNALRVAGVAVSPPDFIGGVSEVYPDQIWKSLKKGQPLPQK